MAMPIHIPFLSRLHIREYIALFLSVVLIALESLISVITLALPAPIISFCYRITRRVFNHLSSPSSRRNREKRKGVWSAIANASDITELCDMYGYYIEEHIVQTGDGYLLGLHRLAWRRGEEDVRVNAGPGKSGIKKKVVYLHHGLMMNSDVWVCLTEKERCLPFALVERGYDVWVSALHLYIGAVTDRTQLGNNRGNKYSKKCLHTSPTTTAFWDFSMDQFAFHDIPDSIDYILNTTHQPSLSYIGFSQGTAQAFASLSIHPNLNDKVDVFIALAPAMSPKGLTSGIVDSFVKASPDVLFLAFGRRAILGSATMWQSILYPPIFVRLIDTSLKFLFGWTGNNIAPHQKLAAYPHLYSFTSTKSVVHWFQIIRNGVFQMYDDEAPNPITPNRSKYYKVAKFPTKNIKTPIVLVYGGSDSLVDINIMLRELPRHTIAKKIPHYEHLDFLWASSVDQLVFPHVFEALEEYANTTNSIGSRKETHFRSMSRHYGRVTESGALAGPEDEDAGDESSSAPAVFRTRKASQSSHRATSGLTSGHQSAHVPQPQSVSAQLSRMPFPPSTYAEALAERPPSDVSPHTSTTFPPPPPKVSVITNADSPASSRISGPSQFSSSKPDAWWSSDEVAGTGHSDASTPITLEQCTSRPSIDYENDSYRQSFDGQKSNMPSIFNNNGISLGTGKAVSGVAPSLVRGEGTGGGMDGGVVTEKVRTKSRKELDGAQLEKRHYL
jgi:lysosomal acid lipase/cholesteryl ester hydrolase